MFYVILGIVVIVALVLIFRDDKDGYLMEKHFIAPLSGDLVIW